MKRTVFFISDGTGITAETLGHSLLSQFEQQQFDYMTIPYVDTLTKAEDAMNRIKEIAIRDHVKPIVFATLVNSEIRAIFSRSEGLLLDFFNVFIDPLEKELQMRSSHRVGRTHGLINYNTYKTRIDAVNFTLSHDDGSCIREYHKADIILVGVSRCGKTPTCLYLALQFGIFAANYPFTEEDLTPNIELPKFLQEYRQKIFGLTIEPQRLQTIRTERRPGSPYAQLEQCRKEIEKVELLFKREKIPYLSSTTRSIEEIATSILAATGVERRLV